MLRMRWKILCLFKDGFCFSIKEAKERRLFLTDDTDNHRSKICDATNARMKVENLFLISLTKTLINLCILPSHNYSSP